jgi:Protein of unknown function (DUF1573)
MILKEATFLLALALLCATPSLSGAQKGQGQSKSSDKQAASASYKGRLASPAFKSEWDFGYAPVGYKMVYQTSLQNVGADTLQLLDVVSTCECTTAKLSSDILPPDSSTRLTINFDTEKFSGLQSRFLEIISTDQHAPERLVQFKAVIGGRPSQVAMLPNSMLLLGGQGGDSLVVKNYTSDVIPFQVAFIDSNLFQLDAEFDYLPADGYTHFYLRALDSIPSGERYSTLTLEFKTKPSVRISMPIKLIRR